MTAKDVQSKATKNLGLQEEWRYMTIYSSIRNMNACTRLTEVHIKSVYKHISSRIKIFSITIETSIIKTSGVLYWLFLMSNACCISIIKTPCLWLPLDKTCLLSQIKCCWIFLHTMKQFFQTTKTTWNRTSTNLGNIDIFTLTVIFCLRLLVFCDLKHNYYSAHKVSWLKKHLIITDFIQLHLVKTLETT